MVSVDTYATKSRNYVQNVIQNRKNTKPYENINRRQPLNGL